MNRIIIFLLAIAPLHSLADTEPYSATVSLYGIPYSDAERTAGAQSLTGDGPGFGGQIRMGSELHFYVDYLTFDVRAESTLAEATGSNLDTSFTDIRAGAGLQQTYGRGSVSAAIEYIDLNLETGNVTISSDQGMALQLSGSFMPTRRVQLYGGGGLVATSDLHGLDFKAGVSVGISDSIKIFSESRNLLLSEDGKDLNTSAILAGLSIAF